MDPIITVMSSKFYRGYPDHPLGEAPTYERLSAALVRRYSTDAHFVAYYVPAIPRRLRVGVLGKHPVAMVVAVFDSDCPAVHGTHEPAPESWWRAERGKIFDLLDVHPDAFVYRSRGGYRIVYVLDPITLSTQEDHDHWKRLYCGWCGYLARVFAIDADRSCKDFARHYRLPFVRRDGLIEERETMGDPGRIGAWNPRMLRSDLPEEKHHPKAVGANRTGCFTGRGRLFNAFQGRNWIGAEKAAGAWLVRCPFEESHSSGSTFDGSTMLYEAAPGYDIGWVHCLHAHCESRSALEYLRELAPTNTAAR